MAKKPKQTNQEDELISPAGNSDDFSSDYSVETPSKEETGLDDDSGFYTMGSIKFAEDEDSDEEFKNATKKLEKEDDSDNEEEWVADEDLNLSDNDQFLDEEDVDWENYAYEKDEY